MSTSPYWRQVPTGWRSVTDEELEDYAQRAVTLLRRAATDRPSPQDTAATPALASIAHWWLTAAPLSAADLLLLACGGHLVPATAADAILRPDSTTRTAIIRAAEEVDDDISLVMAGPGTLTAMEQLHATVDAALTGAHRSTNRRDQAAVFLCARLRPRLFPPSTRFTGISPGPDRWQIYRSVLNDDRVRVALSDLRGTGQHHLPDLALIETAKHQNSKSTNSR